MLSRDANSLYWLSRYIERAENLARLVDVNRYDALDSGRSSAESDDLAWDTLMRVTCTDEHCESFKTGDQKEDVGSFITLSESNPDSIRQCISNARENGRMVRDQISEEIWLELNRLHLFLRSREARNLWTRRPDAFCKEVVDFCLLFNGLIDSTILHNEGWRFVQIGKYLERADKTTRVLDMLALGEHTDRLQIASALRSCSGFSAFRYEFKSDFNMENAVDFLLFSQSFPRSVRYCLRQLDRQLHGISGTPEDGFSNEAERLTGSLLARMNYSSVESVWARGLRDYVDSLQTQFNKIGQEIFEIYVLLPQEFRGVVKEDAWQVQWQQQQ